MRKLILMLALSLGGIVSTQAQTFDFSCDNYASSYAGFASLSVPVLTQGTVGDVVTITPDVGFRDVRGSEDNGGIIVSDVIISYYTILQTEVTPGNFTTTKGSLLATGSSYDYTIVEGLSSLWVEATSATLLAQESNDPYFRSIPRFFGTEPVVTSEYIDFRNSDTILLQENGFAPVGQQNGPQQIWAGHLDTYLTVTKIEYRQQQPGGSYEVTSRKFEVSDDLSIDTTEYDAIADLLTDVLFVSDGGYDLAQVNYLVGNDFDRSFDYSYHIEGTHVANLLVSINLEFDGSFHVIDENDISVDAGHGEIDRDFSADEFDEAVAFAIEKSLLNAPVMAPIPDVAGFVEAQVVQLMDAGFTLNDAGRLSIMIEVLDTDGNPFSTPVFNEMRVSYFPTARSRDLFEDPDNGLLRTGRQLYHYATGGYNVPLRYSETASGIIAQVLAL